jgi:AcrR family transcriptional regulator
MSPTNQHSDPAARPSRLPGEQRREHLLDVAAQLAVEEGIDAVTMEGVAARAGVSKGLGYAYFANRDELLVALYDREMSMLDARVTRAVEAAETLEDKVRASLVEWFDHLAERGAIVGRLMRAQPVHGPVEERRKRRARVVETYWTDLVTAELDIPRGVARAICSAVLTGAGGLLDSWIGRRLSRRDLTAAYTTFVMGGYRALEAAAASAPRDL